MSDFMSVQPVSGIGTALRPTPPEPKPAVVESPNAGSSRSTTDYGQSRNPQGDAVARQEFDRRRHYDESVLTGPPPAFQASLLEVEANLEAIMHRLETAREKEQAEPTPDADAAGDRLDAAPAQAAADATVEPTADPEGPRTD